MNRLICRLKQVLLPGQIGYMLHRNHPHQNMSRLLSLPFQHTKNLYGNSAGVGFLFTTTLGFPRLEWPLCAVPIRVGAGGSAVHLGHANKGVEQSAVVAP